MKSSSRSGECSACGHYNSVHDYETCIARGCRKQIKICGATTHYMPYETPTNYSGWVVCKPCPDHGRTGSKADYSRYPVVAMGVDGNLIITERGVAPEPEEEDLDAADLDLDISQLTLEGVESDSTDPIKVEVHWRGDRIRFNHGGETFKTKPESWTAFTSDEGEVYYVFEDGGLMFFTHEWPVEEAEESGQGSKRKGKGRAN